MGEAGFLAVSHNKGDDWQIIETDYFGSYFSMAKGPENKLILARLSGNVFASDSGQEWQVIPMPMPATINKIIRANGTVYLFANSGNLFQLDADSKVSHRSFADGKAVMAGVPFNDKLILATESGIKVVPLFADARQ